MEISSKQKVTGLPMTAQQSRGETYLMEDEDGFLISVPAEKLSAREQAQNERGSAPLSKAEQQLRDRIVQMVFGPKR